MTHLVKRPLGFVACLILLAVAAGCPSPPPATPPPPPPPPPAGNPVAIYLTVDATYHVTVDPPSAYLHYGKPNADFADWQFAKGATPFVFTIKFDKPPMVLPDPKCVGQGVGYHCFSIPAEYKYKGKHPYSIFVNGVRTDPDVTIDP